VGNNGVKAVKVKARLQFAEIDGREKCSHRIAYNLLKIFEVTSKGEKTDAYV
jgi:hypothetical protein